jgi:hypothetical protein
MPAPDLRLGLAVGGGGSHAVVLDARGATVGKAAEPSPPEVAVSGLVRRALGGAEPGRVGQVMLVTDGPQVDAEGALGRVAILRIGAPMTLGVPPLASWPRELARAVAAVIAVVPGDPDPYSGAPVPLDAEAVRRFAADLGDAPAVAITGVFAPIAGEQELEAAEIVRREAGAGVAISLSQDLGTLGLIERENATVLNAALTGAAGRADREIWEGVAAAGVDATGFVARTDGTLLAREVAVSSPVLTLRGAPAAAVRGAAHLSGLDEAVVADVGRASTTVAVIAAGAPRLSTSPLTTAGIVLGLRMLEAHHIPSPPGTRRLAEAVARAGWVERVSVVLVGAAGRDAAAPAGMAAEAMWPIDGEVAAAVGAVSAPVAGTAERLCRNRDGERAQAREEARRAAFDRVVASGADPGTVELAEIDEVPLTYLNDPGLRIRVRALGRTA